MLARVTGSPLSAQPLVTATTETRVTATNERWIRVILPPGRQPRANLPTTPLRDNQIVRQATSARDGGTAGACARHPGDRLARRRASGRSPDAGTSPSSAATRLRRHGPRRGVHPDKGEQPVVTAVRSVAPYVVGPGAGVEVTRGRPCQGVRRLGACDRTPPTARRRHGRPAPSGRARPLPGAPPPGRPNPRLRAVTRRVTSTAADSVRNREVPARARPAATGSPARDDSASTSARYGAATAVRSARRVITAAPSRRRTRRSGPAPAEADHAVRSESAGGDDPVCSSSVGIRWTSWCWCPCSAWKTWGSYRHHGCTSTRPRAGAGHAATPGTRAARARPRTGRASAVSWLPHTTSTSVPSAAPAGRRRTRPGAGPRSPQRARRPRRQRAGRRRPRAARDSARTRAGCPATDARKSTSASAVPRWSVQDPGAGR